MPQSCDRFMVMNKINLYKKKELIRVDILSFDHKGNFTVEYIECKSWTLKIYIQLNASWIETEKNTWGLLPTLQGLHTHVLYSSLTVKVYSILIHFLFLGDLISPLFNATEYLPENIFTTCLYSQSDLHILWENYHHHGDCL